MSSYVSSFAPLTDSFFDLRKALGYSPATHAGSMKLFDQYSAAAYPQEPQLTEKIVLGWLEDRCTDIYEKSIAMRLFGQYLCAVGQDSYVLSEKYVTAKRNFSPYVFSDEELSRLFAAIDRTRPSKAEPFIDEIAPVLYRMIYTCGLRPQEGRSLKTGNINFKAGEILITHTKRGKDRIVVMSDDMKKLASEYNEKRKIFSKSRFFLNFGYNNVTNKLALITGMPAYLY